MPRMLSRMGWWRRRRTGLADNALKLFEHRDTGNPNTSLSELLVGYEQWTIERLSNTLDAALHPEQFLIRLTEVVLADEKKLGRLSHVTVNGRTFRARAARVPMAVKRDWVIIVGLGTDEEGGA